MASLEPLELLYEAGSLPTAQRLPNELRRLHDGDLGFDEECVYANFVATLDGVVAIPGMANSNDFVAAGSDADRFLMGLLRAFADAVLIGSGVLRASPKGTWRAEHIYPPAAEAYAELRRDLGTDPVPEVAVVTGSGSIDVEHPIFESRALVLTTEAGAAHLDGRLPSTARMVALAEAGMIAPTAIVAALREQGHRRVLCEAGPHTFGGLLADRVVDELFLTSSPLLVGESGPGSRLQLVQGTDLVEPITGGQLLSLRRQGSHVFHRYRLRPTD